MTGDVSIMAPNSEGRSGVPAVVRPRPLLTPEIPPLRHELRRPAWLGLAIVLVFFLIGGVWATTAPLSGAVVASGVVSPEGSRKHIQHLEGGIINDIRVREGEHVAKGDVLVVLEDVGAQAEVGQLTSRLQVLAAGEARLEAERKGAASIAFSHAILSDGSDPAVRAVTEQQVNQFNARNANDVSRTAVLEQRVAQLDQQIVGAQKQLEAVRRQNDLIGEEIVAVREMYEKGYERKPRLLALQRQEADLLGQDGELVARIARAREQIGETRLQILNIRVQRMEDTDKELSDTQAKRAEVEQQIRQSLDRLRRTVIVAPTDGTVLDLQFKTTGGVVRPGDTILDIVPEHDPLIIDAKIRPVDVDDVHTGQHAYAIFPSYPQRTLHRIGGKVIFVAADALQDERTGERYYTVKVEVDRDQLHTLDPNVELTPGMPAEVFLTTVDRTMLQYLVQPLEMVIERSMRER